MKVNKNLWLLICLYTFIVSCSVSSTAANRITVFTLGPQKSADASHTYFVELAELALKQIDTNYAVKTQPSAGQGRAIELLAKSELYDFLWTASSVGRLEQLIQVKFPLFKGGLGWRGSVVRNDFNTTFSAIKDVKSLSKYIACQGMNWPDAQVLRDAKLPVHSITGLDKMFEMVSLGRCDYLPLSIFEGSGELSVVAEKFPNLMFNTSLILQYPLVMNFYVRPDAPKLADDLLKGLIILSKNRQYLTMLEHNPLTQAAFPIEQFRHSTLLTLPNKHFVDHEQLQAYGLQKLIDTQAQ